MSELRVVWECKPASRCHWNNRKRPCWLMEELLWKSAHTHFCSFISGLWISGVTWLISSLSFWGRELRKRAVILTSPRFIITSQTPADSMVHDSGPICPSQLWNNLQILHISFKSWWMKCLCVLWKSLRLPGEGAWKRIMRDFNVRPWQDMFTRVPECHPAAQTCESWRLHPASTLLGGVSVELWGDSETVQDGGICLKKQSRTCVCLDILPHAYTRSHRPARTTTSSFTS